MKRIALISIILTICIVFVCGCADSANKEAETSTETQNTEKQKNKTEFVEEFEKQFEKAVEHDAVKSFLTEIYPNYVFEVIEKNDGTPVLEASIPENKSVPGLKIYFKENAKIFLNGKPAKLNDIKKGDCISVCGNFSDAEGSPLLVTDVNFAIIYR